MNNKNWDNWILTVIVLSSFKLATDTYNSKLDPTGEAVLIIKYIDFVDMNFIISTMKLF